MYSKTIKPMIICLSINHKQLHERLKLTSELASDIWRNYNELGGS